MNKLTSFGKLLVRVVITFTAFSFLTISYAGHTWNNYHWARTANPFTLLVIDSVTTDWANEFETALSKWSQSTVLDLSVTASDDSRRTRKRCSMVKGQMRVCNDTYGANGWLGLATIGLDSNGHIDRGRALMNDTYSSYWNIPGEKNHVMCQEIGHVLGLGHTSEDGSSQQSCMDYSNDPDSQWPNQHDYDQLLSIYSDTDPYNSYDAGETSGGGDSGGGNGCNAPPGKGCNKAVPEIPPMGVRVHHGYNHELWVASRPDGGLWINFVRLVPKEYDIH